MGGDRRSEAWARVSIVPTARRANPSAPKPTLVPWRSTSPALGGAAGTGCAFGTTVFPSEVGLGEVTTEW
jgi:hypothetical protein